MKALFQVSKEAVTETKKARQEAGQTFYQPTRRDSESGLCLSAFFWLLFLALLLCGQFPLAFFSFNQNVVRVFKLLFPCPTQAVIAESIVHEAAVYGVKKQQTRFRLQSTKEICPCDQVFFRKEIEFLQGFEVACVLLQSAI